MSYVSQTEEYLRAAFNSTPIPADLRARWEIFGLVTHDTLLCRFPVRSGSKVIDAWAFWIKGSNPGRERAALGAVITGDALDSLNLTAARDLMTAMVGQFAEWSTAYDEGGYFPEPIPVSTYLNIEEDADSDQVRVWVDTSSPSVAVRASHESSEEVEKALAVK